MKIIFVSPNGKGIQCLVCLLFSRTIENMAVMLYKGIVIFILFTNGVCSKSGRLSLRMDILERRLDTETFVRRTEAKLNAEQFANIKDVLNDKIANETDVREMGLDSKCEMKERGNLTSILVKAFADEKLLNERVRRNVDDLEINMNGLNDNLKMISNISDEIVSLREKIEESNKTRVGFIGEMQQLNMQIRILSDKVTKIEDLVKHGPRKFESCQDLLQSGKDESGMYNIYPNGREIPIRVYCDQETDGGGWTVFQRREDGTVDFYRGWFDYKFGFGNVEGEFWLGNEYIRELTRSGYRELRIDMEDFDNEKRYVKCAKFQIGSKAENYALYVEGYTGDAGDSLGGHNRAPFSTKDRDNDSYGGSCSLAHKGAWWYTSCHSSNLNGLYHQGDHKSYADGVNWQTWRGYRYSLKFVEMKIR